MAAAKRKAPTRKKAPTSKNKLVIAAKRGKTRASATSRKPAVAVNAVPKQLKPHAFTPGTSGNPAGRPKGSRNKLVEQFLTALADDFETYGGDTIVTLREERPVEYIKCVAQLVPREANLNVGGEAFASLWGLVSSGEFVVRSPIIDADSDEERYGDLIN